MPTHNRLQRVHGVSGHSGRQMDLLDTFGPTATLGDHQPPSLCLPLSRLLRRQLFQNALSTTITTILLPPATSTSAVVASATHIDIRHNPDTLTNNSTTITNTSGEDPVNTCPRCNCTFNSHMGLVGHLRVHRTVIGKPVPVAPTYTRCIYLHCPHCPRTFMHRMGLFGHRRIHEGGSDRNLDTPNTSSTPTMPILAYVPQNNAPTATSSIIPSASFTGSTPTKLPPTHTPSSRAPTTTSSTTITTVADTDTADF
nr:unnamed protein product [Spirometra erinaceieuropaei]